MNQMIVLVLEKIFLTIAPCDAAEPWQLGSQDAATPIVQGINDLHHDIFFFLILILVFVSRMLVRALWHFHEQTNPIPQRIVHGTTIEILRTWFFLLALLIFFVCFPEGLLLERAECAGPAEYAIQPLPEPSIPNAPRAMADLDLNSTPGASISFSADEWDFIRKKMDSRYLSKSLSVSLPQADWERELFLPDQTPAPHSLRSEVRWQLRTLFNIGRKRAIFDRVLDDYIAPLRLNQASVGFCRAVLERVYGFQYRLKDGVQEFPFKTAPDREKLYSILWEFKSDLSET